MKQLDKVSRQQELAIIALISGRTPSVVAEDLKISRATLWRWQQLPAFQERWRELRACAVESAIGRLQALTDKAVSTIERLMDGDHAPTAARVAIATLRDSLSGVEEFDTRQKVMQLWREHQEGNR